MAEDSKGKRTHKHDNIKVAVRCRPLLTGERQLCEIVCNSRKNQIGVVIPKQRGRDSNKLYTFDKVYESNTTQSTLFSQSIDPIISDVLEGYNCTVFCYGQTGSGKTYTMEGVRFSDDSKSSTTINTNEVDGIIPRAIKSIFHQLEHRQEQDQIESTVQVSHLEIYNEELQDLLSDDEIVNGYNSKRKKLIIYKDTKRKGQQQVIVQGLEENIVNSPQEIFDILGKSTGKRRTAATNLNQRSSRSHCIFTITIQIRARINTEEIIKNGTLNLVDLAGSESINRSGAQNDRAKEAGHINTSLLTLGRVISALVERRQHIPYRESKLTRLLQESLGGRNKTLLIATIACNSPLEQTLSTLDYALRAKSIQNKPTLNISLTKEKYVGELHEKMNVMKKRIAALESEKGIILPPDQYQNMVQKMKTQQEEIEKMNALFEAEKTKLNEMNILFTKTNDKLTEEIEEKERLQDELSTLSEALATVSLQLRQHQFAVEQYQENEVELRLQATNVRKALKNTINARDMLYDKISRVHSIEKGNVIEWDQQKTNIVGILATMKRELTLFRDCNGNEIMNNKKTLELAKEHIQSIKELTHSLHEQMTSSIQNDLEASQTHTIGYVDTLKRALDDGMKTNGDHQKEINTKYGELNEKVIPQFMVDLKGKLKGIEGAVTVLNGNLQKMAAKRQNTNDGFVQNLTKCIESMVSEMTSGHRQQIEHLDVWKESQTKLMAECKEHALSQISKLFEDISSKQMSLFHDQHRVLQTQMETANQNVCDHHIAPMTSMLSEFGRDVQSENASDSKLTAVSMANIEGNMSSLREQTVSEWTKTIGSKMSDFSDCIETAHRVQNEMMTTMKQKTDEFKSESISISNTLKASVQRESAEIKKIESKLAEHGQSLHDHRENVERQNQESTIPFLEKTQSKLDDVHRETGRFEVEQYRKTGATPTKQNVIYPTKFVETEPLELIFDRFNDERKDSEDHDLKAFSLRTTSSGSNSHSHSSRSSRSSSPYFMAEEIEINFTENELGFKIYPGDHGKNCFIRHCHSDPRVSDDAQIVAIDGIDVIDKSVNYIRTLLATETRPLAIKFKNDLTAISMVNVTLTSKKRSRKEMERSRAKIPKLNYATPNKKRKRQNSSTLSPVISTEIAMDGMDLDSNATDDTEVR